MIDLQAICRQLEQMKCTVHHRHPHAFVEGNSISITACCDEFHEMISDRMDQLMNDQIDSSLDSILGFDETT